MNKYVKTLVTTVNRKKKIKQYLQKVDKPQEDDQT